MEAKISAALATLKGAKFTAEELMAAFEAQGMPRIYAGFACRAVWESGQVKWTGSGAKALGRVAA